MLFSETEFIKSTGILTFPVFPLFSIPVTTYTGLLLELLKENLSRRPSFSFGEGSSAEGGKGTLTMIIFEFFFAAVSGTTALGFALLSDRVTRTPFPRASTPDLN